MNADAKPSTALTISQSLSICTGGFTGLSGRTSLTRPGRQCGSISKERRRPLLLKRAKSMGLLIFRKRRPDFSNQPAAPAPGQTGGRRIRLKRHSGGEQDVLEYRRRSQGITRQE